jgi:hypothetical protein
MSVGKAWRVLVKYVGATTAENNLPGRDASHVQVVVIGPFATTTKAHF